MNKCESCNKEFETNINTCPFCGHKFKENNLKKFYCYFLSLCYAFEIIVISCLFFFIYNRIIAHDDYQIFVTNGFIELSSILIAILLFIIWKIRQQIDILPNISDSYKDNRLEFTDNNGKILPDNNSYGTLRERTYAYIIDFIILYAIISIFHFFILKQITDPIIFQNLYCQIKLYEVMFSLLFPWLYFALLESSRYQGTIGNLCLKMKVVDLNSNRITLIQGIVRGLMKTIPFLVNIIYVVTVLIIFIIINIEVTNMQLTHDKIAKTLVIKETEDSF
ncbi:RDD family protein [uncultured Methanospirillum sp.]|uniref:RDD family protein n=1 Tax=uncultured Methanospirillum sp. TaxID=262503 RepID=UPI00374983CE